MTENDSADRDADGEQEISSQDMVPSTRRLVQNVNDFEEGTCVQADGSGSDSSGGNDVPPAGVPDPWN